MKQTTISLFSTLLVFFAVPYESGHCQEIPLVYEIEHSGTQHPAPVLPDFADLPSVRPLTDPFEWSDGSGRSTRFNEWSRRRSEIKAEIEHYGIGPKPPRPENLKASYSEGTLTVTITVKGATLILTSQITLPQGDGPFPAVIGIGRGSGSLPSDLFTSRRIAQVAFSFQQVMSHTQTRGTEPINALYPELTHIGAYSAWAWGMSRLIDGLELVSDSVKIDTQRIAVTGCSFAGKMALFAGALDERIALTIAQESGGGGAAAWRVSETLGNVETLGNTSNAWFLEDMFRFSNAVHKLPYDHHELMALVAPRALLVLGNPDYKWLADESGYVSCRAAHEIWKTFGIDDRFGFSIVGDHDHCQLPDSQRPEVEAFVDKFLLGDTSANTDVQTHSFHDVNHRQWYDGWLTGTSTFAMPDASNIESSYYEIESATYGSNWLIVKSDEASNGAYATIKGGQNSTDRASSAPENTITVPITVGRADRYYVFGRLNCPSADDDSFWIKIDDQPFEVANGLRTTGWDWVKMSTVDLTKGSHTLTLTHREDGAQIDKVAFTTYIFGPHGTDSEASHRAD